MATYTLPVPFGMPDDETGCTTTTDMQRIIASHFEFRGNGSPQRGGILHHDGLARDGQGVELRPDATLRVHEGAVLLDVSPYRCVTAAIEYMAEVDPGLAPGTAGTVSVAVVPPRGGANDAELITTTGTLPAGAVELERLRFPSGWKTTNQATRVLDRQYAVLRGTANGELSSTTDTDTAARKSGQTYKRLTQSFVTPTDANICLGLSTTIRACNSDGTAAITLADGTTAAVIYEVYLDGELHTTFERTISGYTDTHYLETVATISAGRHQVHVESRLGPVGKGTRANTYWQVMHGGRMRHRGDFLRVRHEGIRW